MLTPYSHQAAWANLEQLLGCPVAIIHSFDVSHDAGQHSVASAVAFDSNGPLVSQYRYFNIVDITPGDDYAALEQAIDKRYRKLDPQFAPSIILIDGGIGQLNRVTPLINNYAADWPQAPIVIGISKGITRKIGNEKFIDAGSGKELNFAPHYCYRLLIKIRDATHNYANKKRQRKAIKLLEVNAQSLSNQGLKIPGIGDNKAKLILEHYNLKELASVTVNDLQQIPGIGKVLAEKVVAHFKK